MITLPDGMPGYRLRVGDWRVIYEIDKNQVVIIVMKIAPAASILNSLACPLRNIKSAIGI